MTERYRAADVRVDRATTHYGQVAEELAGTGRVASGGWVGA
jgi:hypothetical protein